MCGGPDRLGSWPTSRTGHEYYPDTGRPGRVRCAALVTRAGAEALGFTTDELVAIRDSWAEVGVFFEGGIRQHDELLTAASGTVTSPNFPSNYPNNYKHTWAIDPPGPAPVTLTFTAFNNAFDDFVEVRDETGALLSRTSGTTLPPPATATRLLITFGSYWVLNAPGWRNLDVAGDCGGGLRRRRRCR